MTIANLEQAVSRVRKQLADYPPTREYYNHMYSELATRYLLIDPVVQALDWDLHDFDYAAVEWAMPPGQYVRKADYVLFNRRERPVIVIEAKYRGRNLVNHESQLEGYTCQMLSGIGVLTDGMEWRLYNLRRRGDFSAKLIGIAHIVNGNITERGNERSATIRELAQYLNEWLDKDRWW